MIRLLAVFVVVGMACKSPTDSQCTKPLYTTQTNGGITVTTCQMVVVPCPGSTSHC